MTLRLASLAGLAAGTIIAATAAFAEGYPGRAVTMVVPFAAGGPTDTVGRLIAERMSTELGQQVIVENVGGAGGTLGAGQVAAAAADGYTILLHHIGMATSATLYRNLAYKPLEAFDYVGLVTEVPMTIVARKDFEPADGPAFIEYVKTNADQITMANAARGCRLAPVRDAVHAGSRRGHRDGTLQGNRTGDDRPPRRAGRHHVRPDHQHHRAVKGGTIKAYAVTTPARLDVLPDVPTVGELDLSSLEVGIWHGVYAPKGTPAEALEKLTGALKVALADPGIAAKMGELGTKPVPADQANGPALQAKLESEIARWKPIIETAGVFAD